MGRFIGRLIKWAPIIYPIVRKFLNKRKQQKRANPTSPR
ncbi:hypothetical protein RYX56_09690 [Alkalihalophilus lindianensis]|uniref:Uncharacterized protein n=1 Tax=Alkalihalophilus lindianensis TaxID=1630542 RepID=A0ABU3XA10_9BACI|nr:hypothetical protein [Alkalihalophilus lindianensis]MDV2684643.1 hypothetical protein [Alkalihalophilus lindianensis]